MRIAPLSSARSLAAWCCAIVLAGILISPAVASPPTVVGKSIHASSALPALPVMLASYVLGGLLLNTLYQAFAGLVYAHDLPSGRVSVPLRC